MESVRRSWRGASRAAEATLPGASSQQRQPQTSYIPVLSTYCTCLMHVRWPFSMLPFNEKSFYELLLDLHNSKYQWTSSWCHQVIKILQDVVQVDLTYTWFLHTCAPISVQCSNVKHSIELCVGDFPKAWSNRDKSYLKAVRNTTRTQVFTAQYNTPI